MTGTPVESGEWIRNMLEFKDRLHGIIAEKNALGIKDLAVTGRDLIADGIPQGVIIGRILKELFETVLDDPAENEKAHLLTLARNIYAGRT
jgi:poly(A) polymerase/tRNA nucleotidyltransferase (CCA-adding enzyme)